MFKYAALFLFFISTPFFAFAQEGGAAVIADVSIDHVLVVEEEGSTYRILFDVSNGLGVQSGIRYGLVVEDVEEGVVVDGILSEEVLTLREGEVVERSLLYSPDASLDGDYVLKLEARGQSGMPFAISEIDIITVTGTGDATEKSIFETAEVSLLENVILDKSEYQKGEVATVSVVATVPEAYELEVSVADSDGNVCGGTKGTYSPEMLKHDVVVDIEKECVYPVTTVTFTNAAGSIVVTDEYRTDIIEVESDGFMPSKTALVAVIVILALLLAYLLYRSANPKQKVTTLALLLAPVFFFGFAQQADAVTWKLNIRSNGTGGDYSCVVFAGWARGNTTATPSESLATSLWKESDCNSTVQYTVQIGSRVETAQVSAAGHGTGTMYFNAPGTPGSYTMYVYATAGNNFGGSGTPAAETFSLSVVNPTPQPTVELRIRNKTQGGSWVRADGVEVLAADASRLDRSLAFIKEVLTPKAIAGGTVSATQGDTVELQWTSGDARTCQGTSNMSTSGRTSGTVTDQPSVGTKTYALSCTGDGGSASDSARASVSAPSNPPSASIRARVKTPEIKSWHTGSFSIESNEGIQIHYTSENTTRCDSSDFNTFGETEGWRGDVAEPAPGGSRTYTVTCTGPGGTASDSITVSTNQAVSTPSVSLYANPSSITQGQNATLTWSSSNTSTCSGSGSGFSTGNATNGSDGVSPSSTTTYSITCTGPGGSDTDSVNIIVTEPSPTASLEVQNTTQGTGWTGNNITILPSEQIALRWGSSNAGSCNGSNFSTGGSTSGTQNTVTEPSAGGNTVYSISCSGASDSLRVSVQAVDPTLTSNNTQVRQGESVTLSYNMQGNDPTQCTLVGPGVSYLAGSFSGQTGTLSVSISGDSTYTLTCPGGEADVTVELIPVVYDS